MSLRSALLMSALMTFLNIATAQTATQPRDENTDIKALLERIAEQERRIEALERRLQPPSQGATAPTTQAPAPPTATSPERTPAPSSTATAGATAAVAGQAAVSASNRTEAAAGAVIAGPGGVFVQSTDGANVIRLRGNLAVDGRWYSDHGTPDNADTWLLRRARPYIEGTLDNIYDFRFMPDFGNGKAIVVDAFLTARLQPWLVVQAGKFKGPVGLERLQPDQFDRFPELGLTSDLVPNRDLGVEIGGDIAGGVLGYALGYFDGTPDGNSTDANSSPDVDNDGRKDLEGRLFAQPLLHSGNPWLRGLGFGIGATYVNSTGSATNTLLSSYRTPGQQTFFSYRSGNEATYANGRRERWSPQFFYYAGSFGLLGEYVDSRQDVSRQVTVSSSRSARLDNTAWQLSLAYFLSGERETFNSFTAHTTFDPRKGGWGAWEIALRLHELEVDRAAFVGGAASFADPALAAQRALAVGLGLNWYLNQNIKWMLDWERTRFDGGAPNGRDRPDENAFLTRFSLIF